MDETTEMNGAANRVTRHHEPAQCGGCEPVTWHHMRCDQGDRAKSAPTDERAIQWSAPCWPVRSRIA